MELPQEFKTLYRHWDGHVQTRTSTPEPLGGKKLFRAITSFVEERVCVWEKKYTKQSEPYTKDPILQKYRFCNMLRELDRQTIEFHELLNPLRDNFPLWLMNMFYCRMVARPQTVKEVGLLSFDAMENARVYKRLLAYPRPRYGTPYVFPVSVILKSKTPTRELFITKHLSAVMADISKEIASWEKKSVSEGVAKILPLFGFNLSFLWTEVLIDTAYQYPEHVDLFKEFPVGPGALPTFKRIDASVTPSILAKKLGALAYPSGLTVGGKPIVLSAENWEGVGCEFRKYTNLSSGKGRKRVFRK